MLGVSFTNKHRSENCSSPPGSMLTSTSDRSCVVYLAQETTALSLCVFRQLVNWYCRFILNHKCPSHTLKTECSLTKSSWNLRRICPQLLIMVLRCLPVLLHEQNTHRKPHSLQFAHIKGRQIRSRE